MRLRPFAAAAMLALGLPPTSHGGDASPKGGGASAQAVEKFLAGWAVREGDERDAVTGFPKQVRRTKDGMLMVLIPAGTFQMGAVPGDEHAARNELPRHAVTLSRAYYLDECEVTVGMWKAYVKEKAMSLTRVGEDSTDQHPKFGLSWDDVQGYLEWAVVSLPTEAQWERAARAGHDDYVYPWGTADEVKMRNGPETEDGHEDLASVKSYAANGYGLHDMAGNAWEWCADVYDREYYATSPAQDPQGPPPPSARTMRVMRGGAFVGSPDFLRVSNREAVPQTSGVTVVQGLRCAKTLP